MESVFAVKRECYERNKRIGLYKYYVKDVFICELAYPKDFIDKGPPPEWKPRRKPRNNWQDRRARSPERVVVPPPRRPVPIAAREPPRWEENQFPDYYAELYNEARPGPYRPRSPERVVNPPPRPAPPQRWQELERAEHERLRARYENQIRQELLQQQRAIEHQRNKKKRCTIM